jgi:hypothetical protein
MNIYNRRYLNEMLEEDEISVEEQGFMQGYLEAFKN